MTLRKDLCMLLLLDSTETNRYEYLHDFRVICKYLKVMASIKIGKPVKVLSRKEMLGWLKDCTTTALRDKVLQAKATDDNAAELWEWCSGTDARSEFWRRLEAASELWLQNQQL
ncbi:hypothetical protein FRC06_009243 [Ceratobasidium sp. 370]|nr:hypothetical protein FRC06_009243 [Ceratobasidium sp. 370]